MTLRTTDLAGARIVLAGPLTDEAHLENFLLAAILLERAGACVVVHPLSPDHPANSPDLFGDGEFDPATIASWRTSASPRPTYSWSCPAGRARHR